MSTTEAVSSLEKILAVVSAASAGDTKARVPFQPSASDDQRLVLALNQLLEHLASRTEELRIANDDLSSFTYAVSHDLRAPLRAIGGFAHIALETYKDTLDGDGQECLGEIVASTKKMSEYIDALTMLARITRAELRLERADLSAIARETAHRFHERAKTSSDPGPTVTVHIEDGIHADVDLRAARSLFDQILDNAWKFTSKTAKPTIELGIAIEADGSPSSPPRLFVRDNGVGFDMAYASKLFTPFQRLHTADEFAGVGIGLAIVQRIVRRHGGHVSIEATVGGGATLSFTLQRPTTTATALSSSIGKNE